MIRAVNTQQTQHTQPNTTLQTQFNAENEFECVYSRIGEAFQLIDMAHSKQSNWQNKTAAKHFVPFVSKINK